jgi:hypothetical protein
MILSLLLGFFAAFLSVDSRYLLINVEEKDATANLRNKSPSSARMVSSNSNIEVESMLIKFYFDELSKLFNANIVGVFFNPLFYSFQHHV